jgi:pyrimidine operon attenuation protein/uracil phosphoribosyltransferase
MNRTLILTHIQIDQKINRIAYEIFENNYDESQLIVAGIAGNGYLLAKRIVGVLKKIAEIKIELLEIVVNKKNPLESEVLLNLNEKEIKNKVIILVDDVLNSGKTLMFGAKPFLNVPIKRLTTVVLIDRGHNRYPIKADIVGLSLSTTMQEHITVELDTKGDEKAFLS